MSNRTIVQVQGLRHRLAAVGSVATLVVLFALVSWIWSRTDDSLQRVRERGELRIGYAIEPPFALLKQDATPGGESPEVAREVARRLGLRATWVLTEFDRLIPELESGRFDVIAAGMFVTPQRMERVRFSRPTLRVRPGWLRRAGATDRLGSYADAARHPGLRVAVVSGSVEAQFFEPLLQDFGRTLVVPDARSGREAVAASRCDALALSMPTVAVMAAESAGRLVAEPADGPGVPTNLVGLAVRRDDVELSRAIDEALNDYLGGARHLFMLHALGLGKADLPETDHVAR